MACSASGGDAARAAELLQGARRVLIGAGAGLSAAAGLSYGGERFARNFAPFIEKYGMTDMYSAGFYPFPSEEARWGYWARHVWVNRHEPDALPLYRALHAFARERDGFVVTTNVDAQFEKAGFLPERLFAVQGDYGLLQCARSCHDALYPNRELVARMLARTEDCLVPSELVPACPVCGGPMAVAPAVLLELGVGWNTPGIVRFPFEALARATGAPLVRLNYDDARLPEGVPGVGLQGDIAELWPLIMSAAGRGKL